ncbi:MAG TPA: helix-turn-helix domain-containing protein, partial [Sphingomicrobium sp.]|nr:helix-turn-helix domain-containing protein [Sphingomicrobium sp.]
PLRERNADIPALVRHFAVLAVREGLPMKRLDDAAMERLRTYRWPGNVRELENRLKRAVIMADGRTVGADDLDLPGTAAVDQAAINLRAAREVADRRAIRQAMVRTDNNISGAAKLLGISRPTLYDLLKQYRLQA